MIPMIAKDKKNKIYTIVKDRETFTAATQSQSPATVKSNMFFKGYPLEAKTAPKNWNLSVYIFWARQTSFCHLDFFSDPLIVSKFHNETHDRKRQENKIYTIVKGRDITRAKRSARSQQVTIRRENIKTEGINYTNDPHKKLRLGTASKNILLEGLNQFHGAYFTDTQESIRI